MKNIYIKYLFISFNIFLLMLSGCKKVPFDFRNKYCGEWNFTTEYRFFSPDSLFDTVYNYNSEIWYDEKGKINIEYRKDITLEFDISEDGEITFDAYYDVRGNFSDKNNMSFSRRTGGLGSGVRESVTGIKK